MANYDVGELRRSATIMTSGPGAIVDMRSDNSPVSGVHLGLEDWDRETPLSGVFENQKIYERRLCKKLGKKYFRLPPVIMNNQFRNQASRNANQSLVIRRFPSWLQCPSCSTIGIATKWAGDPGHASRFCAICTEKRPGKRKVYVVPVRFVAACENGHLDEFPWHFWVKHKEACSNSKGTLKLLSRGPGLAGLFVICQTCKSERSLESSFRKTALLGLKCQGRSPWLDVDDSKCGCSGTAGNYRILQRGASNLYYPIFETALDIPPFTEAIQNILNDRWDDLVGIEDDFERLKWIEQSTVLRESAERVGMTLSQLNEAFISALERVNLADKNDLRIDEFKAFTQTTTHNDLEFEKYLINVPESLKNKIDKVARVARLREVRVLRGFTRINPPGEDSIRDGKFAMLSVDPNIPWLPAIEIRGEGIFISFSTDALTKWSNRKSVKARIANLVTQHRKEYANGHENVAPEWPLSAKRLMLHSFSHILIKQLTLDCGYSSSSLRERLYVDDDPDGMCGVLIYTGTSDSDGTLGGLQSRAEMKLLESTIRTALTAAHWCSSDPLCISGDMTQADTVSISACHSCLLLPETSCEYHNRFLDRALLTGTVEDPSVGYF